MNFIVCSRWITFWIEPLSRDICPDQHMIQIKNRLK
jgi:hypothetical protein